MSLISSIQSAPEFWGSFDDLDGGAPNSSALPTLHGPYTGREEVLFTFGLGVAISGYTLGTNAFSVPYSFQVDGVEVAASYLQVPASYTAGDKLALGAFGLSISLSPAGGDFFDSDQWTTTLKAKRRVRRDHVEITGNALPVDIQLLNDGLDDRDEFFVTNDQRAKRSPRAILRSPSIALDYLEPTEEDRFARIKHARHDVTVFENYDHDTLLLWKAQGGSSCMVGPSMSMARSGTASYVDADTGLLRVAAADTIRYEAGQANKAACVSKASTNLMPRSHPQSGSLGWAAQGTATIVWDETVQGVLDPLDDNWNAAARKGVARARIPTGGANHIDSSNFTVSSSTEYVASVWLKGRGVVRFTFRAGAGSPSSTIASGQVTLTRDWARYEITGTTGVSDNTADMTIGVDSGSDDDSIVYVSGSQFETGDIATPLIETTGSSASRNAETLTCEQPIPADEGTLSFWMYWPGGDAATTYTILDATGVSGSQRFRFQYLATTNLGLFVASSGGTSILPSFTGGLSGWEHIVLTWQKGTSDDMLATCYRAGSLVTSGDIDWEDGFGTGFQLGDASSTNLRFQEVRIDNRAWTAEEVSQQYDRLTAEHWLAHHRSFSGRKFWVSAYDANWLDLAVPGKKIARVDLTESDSDDDSLVYAR